MINFVEIQLADPSYLAAHDQLDAMLADGWEIIAHIGYEYDGEPMERYTLWKWTSEKKSPIDNAKKVDELHSKMQKRNRQNSPIARFPISRGAR